MNYRNNGKEDYQQSCKGQGLLKGMADTVFFGDTVKGG